MAIINGSSGHSTIFGSLGSDIISDMSGNNTVLALFGNKEIHLGGGNDIVTTGAGDDVIYAGDGNNIVVAGSGNNQVFAGVGDDKIITLSGDDFINAGDGANCISSGSGNDIVITGSGADTIDGGAGNDHIYAGAGNDYIDAGANDDLVYGGSGSDRIDGGSGNDVLYGDGQFETQTVTQNFLDSASWLNSISADGTKINLQGLTATANGGVFANYSPWGLSVNSPSDNPVTLPWTSEIDAYNDTSEHVLLSFDSAQSSVAITLRMLYIEQGFSVMTEKATFTLTLDDGSTMQITGAATATKQPGEFSITLDASLTGGKLIKSIDLTPDISLPPGVPPAYQNTYNASHPYSEFTIASVSYQRDANAFVCNDDTINGGSGNDHLYGGYGNDKLSGDSGDDYLDGGQGNNLLCGGAGNDTFAFGAASTGISLILDFCKNDKLAFGDGITVVSSEVICHDTVLKLSNNGIVILKDTANGSSAHLDYLHSLYDAFTGML